LIKKRDELTRRGRVGLAGFQPTPLFLLLSLFLCTPSQAAPPLDTFFRCVTRLQDAFGFRSKSARVHSSIKTESVRRWLGMRMNPRFNARFSKKIGDRIDFNEESLTVIAGLGSGAEGEVYIVEAKDGLRTLKTFFETSQMVSNLKSSALERNVEAWAERSLSEGVSSPRIISIDRGRNHLLYEYLDAIPLDQIKMYREEIGLSPEEAEDFTRHAYMITDANLVYSFLHRKIFLIDPY
jgi:hypothetical protein